MAVALHCAPAHAGPQEDAASALLDRFHSAAAKADFDAYFATFTPDGVFLGTDATERWTVAQFKAYAKPHFDKGRGWTYTKVERNINVCLLYTSTVGVLHCDRQQPEGEIYQAKRSTCARPASEG